MKKLIIALAAVATGIAANAATVTWGVSKVAYSDAVPYVDSTTAGKYVAYLIDNSFAEYADFDAAVAALQKDGASAKGVIFSTAGADAFASGAHTISFTSGTKAALQNEPQTYTSGQIINAYTIIFDGAAATAENYMAAEKDISFNTSLNLSAAFGVQSSNEWVAVPEPTSGLLLLLGVAGLALRRRRA